MSDTMTLNVSIGEGEAHCIIEAYRMGLAVGRGELPEPRPDHVLSDVLTRVSKGSD